MISTIPNSRRLWPIWKRIPKPTTNLRRRDQDRRIAEAIQDVPVPGDLKQRLLGVLEEDPVRVADESSEVKKPASRRRWMLSALVVLASSFLAAVGIWLFYEPEPELLTVQELETDAPYTETEFARLSEFSGSFKPTLPEGLWVSDRRFTFSGPKGFAPTPEGADRVAVYEFHFRDPRQPRGGVLRGVMLVLPKSELEVVPESQSFFDGTYVTTQAQPRVAIRAWTERDRVYLCLVPIADFETLSRTLESPLG